MPNYPIAAIALAALLTSPQPGAQSPVRGAGQGKGTGKTGGPQQGATGGQKPAPPLAGAARLAFQEKIAASMAKVRTVIAGFEQEKHYGMFDEVAKQQGVILYERPDRLRWEIRQPFRSILIVAGNDVAKFEYRDGERRKLRLGRGRDVLLIVMEQIRGWFRGDFEKAGADYDVEFFDKAPARIVMRPKSKSMRKTIESFELLLDEDLSSVTRVTIHEKNGDKTVMRFTRQPSGKSLDRGYFDTADPRDYTPPKKNPDRRPGR